MKRYLLAQMLVIFLIITACGTNDVSKEESESKEREETSQVDEQLTDDPVKEETGNSDEKLTEVGQKIVDKNLGATVELMKMKEVNETVELDPIKLTIEDIKFIRLSDIKKNDLKSFIAQITDKEEFDYIQIMFSIENTSEENIEFYMPIEYIVLNTGEQIDVGFKDIMLDLNNGGEFFGKVKKDTGISVVIEDTELDEIESIKLITGDVWQKDGDLITNQQEIEYEIN